MSSLIFAFPAMAQDKFWISNKIEVGYSKTFISNQIKFNQDEFIKNDFAVGLKFKLTDTSIIRTHYLLENSLRNAWKNNHFLGIKLNIKLQ